MSESLNIHSTTFEFKTYGQQSKSNTRSFIVQIVNIFGRDFRKKKPIRYNHIEKEILAKSSNTGKPYNSLSTT